MSGNTKPFHTPENTPATPSKSPIKDERRGYFTTPVMPILRKQKAKIEELEAMKARCEELAKSWLIIDPDMPNIVLWINKKHSDELRKAITGNNKK